MRNVNSQRAAHGMSDNHRRSMLDNFFVERNHIFSQILNAQARLVFAARASVTTNVGSDYETVGHFSQLFAKKREGKSRETATVQNQNTTFRLFISHRIIVKHVAIFLIRSLF